MCRFTKKINVPTLVMRGDDGQIVPNANSGSLSAKLIKNATLKTYERLPRGVCTAEADTINAVLVFIKS